MRIFGAPRRYIQGPGALATLGSLAERHGGAPLLVVDRPVRDLLGDALTGSFAIAPPIIEFEGEITLPVIEGLVADARTLMANASRILVYGIGGGKALDAAKGITRRLGADFVSVPTIASNDSPAGRAIAIYDDHHRLALIEYMDSSPEAVVVDSAVIARAPARFLRSGIGDAIAKKFEAERANSDGANNYFGTRPLLSALAMADACYSTLRAHGAAAMRAAESHSVTPALEAAIEASVLMAGIAWESGGISLSHGVVRGIARSPGAQTSLHGEQVAYGLLVQLAIELRTDAFIIDLMRFYDEIGQATTLRGLGIQDDGPATIEQIARWTTEAPKGGNVIISASVDEIRDAIIRVELLAERDRAAAA